MTDLKKLKTTGKGQLPERGISTAQIIAKDTRIHEGKSKKKPLQVMIDETEFNDFSAEAAAMFGHRKGAKSLYFSYIFKKLQCRK